jgi:uncharacterized short protein YbdD (DUF466 family)
LCRLFLTIGLFLKRLYNKEKIIRVVMADKLFEEKYYFKNQKNIIDGVAVDPLLPNDFYDTPNEERSTEELANWWGRPFILTQAFIDESYEEYCERMIEFNPDGKWESFEDFNTRREEERRFWSEKWVGGIRYDVECLTGGAWDRPSLLGSFSTLEEALSLAKKKPKMYQLLNDDGSLELPIFYKEALERAGIDAKSIL